jgi:HEAT repeat protein
MVLGLLNDPSATKMLMTLLSDRVPSVRLQAAEALWRLGNERGLTDLVAFSISAYPDDQMIALQALAETGDQRVIQHIRGQLTNDYVEVSLAAARGLGLLGSDEGWNIVVPAAKSHDPRQRAMAALAMGSIGRTDLQPYLADLLKDPEAPVRISAATGILQLHSPAVTNAN